MIYLPQLNLTGPLKTQSSSVICSSCIWLLILQSVPAWTRLTTPISAGHPATSCGHRHYLSIRRKSENWHDGTSYESHSHTQDWHSF